MRTGCSEIRKRVTMVFQNGALFDSLSVRENVAFPLRERGGLEEDQVLQIVDRLLNWWVRTMSVARQPFHGTSARRSHCARAGRSARSGSLRRADHDGRSDNRATSWRNHPAPEEAAWIHKHRRDA